MMDDKYYNGRDTKRTNMLDLSGFIDKLVVNEASKE